MVTMDTRLIEAYAAAMSSQSQMTEVEISADGLHIRLRRSIVATDGDTSPIGESETQSAVVAKDVAVTAQSVGVFVPAEPAFSVGDEVDGTRSLGAIDTVGITNAIVSPVKGVITSVLVESGQPVEYGQKLFEINEGNKP